jgi:high-affinity iron transporter
MGASFLITLREGLEIALVLAILAAYLVKSGRASSLRAMWTGAAVAAAVCVVAGVAFHQIVGEFEGKKEQFIEGSLAVLAAVVLTWMIFWMRKHSRGLSSEMRNKLDMATTAKAVAFVAFIAVLREGFETVLFLLSAETSSASGASVVVGGLIGLAVSAALGLIVYRRGQKVNLATFFRVTGILLILFAAGLVGKAFHEFREFFGFETGRLISPSLWNIESGPFASGTVFDFLKGLFGWAADPEPIRVIAYVAYLVPVLWLFVRKPKVAPTVGAEPTAAREPSRIS